MMPQVVLEAREETPLGKALHEFVCAMQDLFDALQEAVEIVAQAITETVRFVYIEIHVNVLRDRFLRPGRRVALYRWLNRRKLFQRWAFDIASMPALRLVGADHD